MPELKKRYLSLDVFRGMDIALMIVVNTPGSWSTTFSPFLHADWHGFTLTDLVFPTFLFVVGNSMSFSLSKYENTENSDFLFKVIKRAIIIFLVGFLLYWYPFFEDGQFISFHDTRIFGVLQRIALCYLFASLILRYWNLKGALYFSVFALIFYQIIMLVFGDLTLNGNAALKLDVWLIGEKHMYSGEGVAFDPEGLLSTLPAIVNVIAGYMTGIYLQKQGQNFEMLAKLLLTGCLLIFFAFVWDLNFPINKKIWTSSYVLLTIGIDLVVLSFLVYTIDMEKKRSWTYFFEVFGKNPLFIYLLSGFITMTLLSIDINGVVSYAWIANNLFMSWLGDYLGSFSFALFIMLICWMVGYVMDKLKIYIKV